METIRNIVFGTICTAIFLICAWGGIITGHDEASSPTRSYLEGREYQAAPEISLGAFLDSSLQDETESFLSDIVPNRDGVVLLNARIQRSVIETANLPFAFDAYHTFLGSKYVYSPSLQRLYEKPFIAKEWDKLCQECFPKYKESLIATRSAFFNALSLS